MALQALAAMRHLHSENAVLTELIEQFEAAEAWLAPMRPWKNLCRQETVERETVDSEKCDEKLYVAILLIQLKLLTLT